MPPNSADDKGEDTRRRVPAQNTGSRREGGEAAEEKSPEGGLSLGQIAAAAGASTIGAIVAKLTGLWGTVWGTAILSICATVGTVYLQRVMRSTHSKVRTQMSNFSSSFKPGKSGGTPEKATAVFRVPSEIQADPSLIAPEDADATRTLPGGAGLGKATGTGGTLSAAADGTRVQAAVGADDATRAFDPDDTRPLGSGRTFGEDTVLVAADPDADIGDTQEFHLVDAEEQDKTARRRKVKRNALVLSLSSLIVFALTMGALTIIGQTTTGEFDTYYNDSKPVKEPEKSTPPSPEGTREWTQEPTEDPTESAPEETTEEPSEEPTEEPPTEEPTDETSEPDPSEPTEQEPDPSDSTEPEPTSSQDVGDEVQDRRLPDTNP
ncbi:hypothetical protein [Salininema proteolyticum]|uniref:Uncharacterized protein n=1 Tax=Salininema proteolyticum TaxID=1607685 RepID=A0ABV8U0C5_9ACTN